MSDIVQKLRQEMRNFRTSVERQIELDAAAEIERLLVKADTLQFLLNQRDIDIESLRSRLTEACDELRNIANAQPSKWEPDVADQFQSWAQSRARHTLARIYAHLARKP